jgi:hypothetical protein
LIAGIGMMSVVFMMIIRRIKLGNRKIRLEESTEVRKEVENKNEDVLTT